MVDAKLDCSNCLSDAKLQTWSVQQARHYLSALSPSETKVRAFGDCFARAFKARFRKPGAIGTYKSVYQEVVQACGV